MGPVWSSSPIRRCVQTLCFLLFLYQFFWVCWPYNASPDTPSRNWLPLDVDVESGRVTLVRDAGAVPSAAEPELSVHSTVFVTDESTRTIFGRPSQAGPDRLPSSTELPPDHSEIQIAAHGPNGLVLDISHLTPEQQDELSVSSGPWSLNPRDPQGWPRHFADNLSDKETIAAESFLAIDPLVSLSTAVASRAWVWSLTCAGIILMICVVIPRGFCGYLCPLGTLIDLFDWLIGTRIVRFRVPSNGWWVHLRYWILLTVMTAAAGGILLSGYVSAIPVITRGLQFTLAPLQNGAANGWHQMPPLHAGHFLSIGLFLGTLSLGLLRPRFWCSYVCPSGAVFSVGNLFRISERKVESSCIHCNKCVEICPFDAIRPDFTTRTTDCTLCQSCGGVCPTHAIKFVGRWEVQGLKPENDPPVHETALGRRGFLSAAVGTSTSLATGTLVALTVPSPSVPSVREPVNSLPEEAVFPEPDVPVRPPGSVPEQQFLQMCIRCGECFKACPSDVLQPLDFRFGINGLWTPHVVADWSGCASSCNACGQVCPTGAIRALPLEVKRQTRMGLAIINPQTCLPIAGVDACQLCVDECTAAGYDAIEFIRIGTEADEHGMPIEGSGFLAPLMIPDKCVGCGLCQTRCYAINVVRRNVLSESAIVVHAGRDREDR
ncbi:MAG: 4Fe-4S binding protein [Planctomycetaceae bacterium]|nr:4Fe-4S binding protein [Planctomycetaceae bacterium]